MFYVDLFSALARHKVDYLLIGGLAVSLHGVERATMDVDITVAMNPDNLAALIEAAKELKLSPVLPIPLESLRDLELLRQWHAERHLEAFEPKRTKGASFEYFLSDLDLNRTSSMMKNISKLTNLTDSMAFGT